MKKQNLLKVQLGSYYKKNYSMIEEEIPQFGLKKFDYKEANKSQDFSFDLDIPIKSTENLELNMSQRYQKNVSAY